MKYTSLVLFCLLFFTSCEKKQEIETFDESKFGYDYFPLELGRSWTYQVDSIIYDDQGSKIIETSSQVKEEIVEEFVDLAGDTIHRIERFWRKADSTQWRVTDVWVAAKSKHRATRTEENLKFVKFVFPAIVGSSWNGNVFFDETTVITIAGESVQMFLGWDNYRLESIDESEEIGGVTYPQVATILQTDRDDNAIEKRYAIEKYGRGIGLIYKENIILDTQNADVTIPWTDRAEKGFILKQTLIEYN